MKKKNFAYIYYIFLFIYLCFFPGCTHKRTIDKKELYFKSVKQVKNNHGSSDNDTYLQIDTTDQPPPITIWVHGTLLFRKPNYHNVFQNKNTLVPATELPKNNVFYSIATTMSEHDSHNFPLETFYFFGWSGKLYANERKMAAEKLYQEILILTEQYKKQYNTNPVIQIIAHSHGANVVLNMAKIKTYMTPITINTFILLACPVQEKTMNLISKPMFKNIYSLYSSLDFIQILAPQITRRTRTNTILRKKKHPHKFPHFSSRLFPQQSHIMQIKIKFNGHPITHTSFTALHFIQILPTILATLISWQKETVEKNSFNMNKLLCVYSLKNLIGK